MSPPLGTIATAIDLRRLHRQAGEDAIGQLVSGRAMPVIERELRAAAARGAVPAADIADLAADVELRVLRRLRRAAAGPRADPHADLEGYVHATVHFALDDHRRRRHPLHALLGQRVRYVLTHTRGLAVWNHNPTICGLEEWIGGAPVPIAAPERMPMNATAGVRPLRAAVEQVLRRSAGPVKLHALVDALAEAGDLTRQPFVAAAALVSRAGADDPLARLEERDHLRESWQEIVALPLRQRRALLLQLHLDDGDSVTRLLPTLGIVGLAQVAAALEMPLAELRALWNELPLEDQRIAGMLGVTRQQVINLRKCARERLARRLGRRR
ncbi:MAG TPA: hypothetical protein VGS57_05785 [Thermoanaerobaculia bacterium]|jgi:hypothetical protein|nr:hypothetical protein [Thermoanaerobaculia bacterium]